MQLILLNSSAWFREVYSGDYFTVTYESEDQLISRSEVTWLDGKTEVAEKLLGELFQGRDSMLKVILRNEGFPSQRYTVQVKHSERMNILGNLRDRFYDRVKISVSVGVGGSEEASTEEMVIKKPGQWTRKGHILLNEDLLMKKDEKNEEYEYDDFEDVVIKKNGFSAKMTITAHIHLTDDEILSSAEPPPGKMILEEKMFSDLTIVAMDGIEIPAHKSFLSVASPVLRVQFGATWSEREEESNSGKLDMSDVSEKGVKAFLRYVYYRDLEEAGKDPEIAYELLYTAHKYDIFPLEAKVIERMLDMEDKDFTVESAFTIFAFVRNINIDSAEELKCKTAHILMSNIDALEKLPEFKELLEHNSELRNEILSAAEEGGTSKKKKRKVAM